MREHTNIILFYIHKYVTDSWIQKILKNIFVSVEEIDGCCLSFRFGGHALIHARFIDFRFVPYKR